MCTCAHMGAYGYLGNLGQKYGKLGVNMRIDWWAIGACKHVTRYACTCAPNPTPSPNKVLGVDIVNKMWRSSWRIWFGSKRSGVRFPSFVGAHCWWVVYPAGCTLNKLFS